MKILLAVLALTTTVAMAPAAKADSFNFSFSGGGLSATGVIDVSSAVPGVAGAYQVTGIHGTFSDANTGLTNASITGLVSTSLPSPINGDGTFLPPGTFALTQPAGDEGLSFDNLFYPNGDSPAICPPSPTEAGYPFHGGSLDIYGVLFTVDGGYTVDMWSNGVLPGTTAPDYGVTDAIGTTRGNSADVSFAASPVPEPGTLMLLGTGMLGFAGSMVRKFKQKA
jgi:hypothetical protein